MEFGLAFLFFLLCFLIATSFFLSSNEELPLFVTLYTGLVLVRLYLLQKGEVDWVNFDYGIYFEFNMDLAYHVGSLIILGTVVLVSSYFFFYKQPPPVKRGSSTLLKQFLQQKKMLIIVLFGLFFLFQLTFGHSLSHGYATDLTLANSAFIVLLFFLFYTSQTSNFQKILFALFTGVLAYSTYSSENRFQFLGWAIPIIFLLLHGKKASQKLLPLILGTVVILVFFSMARTLRSEEVQEASFEEKYAAGFDRLLDFEDINFIDGFMMLYQVYPEYLDFGYGMDHLAILFRPIPRAFWPGKPRAGWHQKYAEKYNFGESYAAGFSPTLYGVFYGEGGVLAIILFSILWGWFLARLSFFCNSYGPDLAAVLKGILLASLIPILRSGDLAGDVAVVCMSFWPIFIFVYLYNKFLKKEAFKQINIERMVAKQRRNFS